MVGFVAIGLLAAMGAASVLATPPAQPSAAPDPAHSAPPTGGELVGFCEASAIVSTDRGFLVGDNETEDRLHRLGPDLQPDGALPLSAPVEDIEALTTLPDGQVLVVGSQGRNKHGRRKPLREQVLVIGASPVTPDLTGCAPCVAAVDLAPKQGGVSVEGAASWQGATWLGLRSPLVDGDALLLRMDGDPRQALAVAQVVQLPLGGDGVRDLVVHDGRLLVLAGPPDGADRPHRLFQLDGPDATPTPLDATLPAGSEGMVVHDGQLLVVTDGDGEPGGRCARPARWLRMPLPTRP